MSDTDHSENPQKPDIAPVYLGMFANRHAGADLSLGESVAIGAGAVWFMAAAVYFWIAAPSGGGPAYLGVALLVCLLPALFVGLAIYVARAVRLMREESERLQLAINAMRQTLVQRNQSGVLEMTPSFERKLEEIAAAQRSTEARLARFTSIRPDLERAEAETRAALHPAASENGGAAPAPEVEQPSLALATPAESVAAPLSVADFIKALDFPADANDKEGFRALRRAMADRNAGQLLSAAQDVLTLLSQDGIYMDDLTPDRARPEIWRRFAKGERGKSIAILGGIRDRSSLALAAGRMRQDTIFRDCVHHFLRKFDQTFAEFEKTASDLDIVALTDTRSARAFMLLGRVTGMFD